MGVRVRVCKVRVQSSIMMNSSTTAHGSTLERVKQRERERKRKEGSKEGRGGRVG